MKIVQEIGSYAGLAAILGLAVLAALYFSQARDVRRLREWAGRAPERAPETSGVPAATAAPARPQGSMPTRAPVRPVPRAPGQTAQQQAVRPSPAAAAAGAKPATATGPAASTGPAAATPAARAAGAAKHDEVDGSSNGTDDQQSVLDQDTVVHPPPSPPGEEGESEEFEAAEGASEEFDAPEGESGESDAVSEEFDSREQDALDDEGDWDEDSAERDALDPEAHWEDTGDQPLTPLPPRRTVPSPSTSDAPTTTAASGGSILPPYEESRPGGTASGSGAGPFSSRGRGAAVIGAGVIALAIVVFGVTRLLGGGDDNATGPNASSTTGQSTQQGQRTTTSGQSNNRRRAAAVNPASVRVAVLNGTTVPGLAAQIGDEVSRQGFKLGTVTNFNDQQRAESVVLYAPGAEREAAEVGRRLKISQREPIDPESQSVAGDATVAVVAGRDKTP